MCKSQELWRNQQMYTNLNFKGGVRREKRHETYCMFQPVRGEKGPKDDNYWKKVQKILFILHNYFEVTCFKGITQIRLYCYRNGGLKAYDTVAV